MIARLQILLGHVNGQFFPESQTFVNLELSHCLAQQCDICGRMIDHPFAFLNNSDDLLFGIRFTDFVAAAYTKEIAIQQIWIAHGILFVWRQEIRQRHWLATALLESLLPFAHVFGRFVIINARVLCLQCWQSTFYCIAEKFGKRIVPKVQFEKKKWRHYVFAWPMMQRTKSIQNNIRSQLWPKLNRTYWTLSHAKCSKISSLKPVRLRYLSMCERNCVIASRGEPKLNINLHIL